jgi:hypothetical protein
LRSSFAKRSKIKRNEAKRPTKNAPKTEKRSISTEPNPVFGAFLQLFQRRVLSCARRPPDKRDAPRDATSTRPLKRR